MLLTLCSRSFKGGKTIVFFRTKQRAHRAKILFGLAGLPPAAELHGNMSQSARLESLDKFRKVASLFADVGSHMQVSFSIVCCGRSATIAKTASDKHFPLVTRSQGSALVIHGNMVRVKFRKAGFLSPTCVEGSYAVVSAENDHQLIEAACNARVPTYFGSCLVALQVATDVSVLCPESGSYLVLRLVS